MVFLPVSAMFYYGQRSKCADLLNRYQVFTYSINEREKEVKAPVNAYILISVYQYPKRPSSSGCFFASTKCGKPNIDAMYFSLLK